MVNIYKILGINDEVTTCECCNRANLKKTVIISDSEGLAEMRYGTSCASRLLGKSENKIKDLAAFAERERTRLIKYYMVFNLTSNVYVANGETREFATLELANARVARMANSGLQGEVRPIYQY